MPCAIYSIIFFIKTLRGYNRWCGCTEKGRNLRVCVLRLDRFAGNSGQSQGSRNLVSRVNDVERYFKPKLKSFLKECNYTHMKKIGLSKQLSYVNNLSKYM